MNRPTYTADGKPIFVCNPDPKPRILPKIPQAPRQRSQYTKGKIVRTKHHLGTPVQSDITRPLTPPLTLQIIRENKAKSANRNREIRTPPFTVIPPTTFLPTLEQPKRFKDLSPAEQEEYIEARYQATHPEINKISLCEQQAELARYLRPAARDLLNILAQASVPKPKTKTNMVDDLRGLILSYQDKKARILALYK